MKMENAKTYILSKLSHITKSVPELKILYKYDFLTRDHLIKVLPLDEYKNNEEYHTLEEELLFSFIEKFPNDSLVFLSEGDWIDIESPDEVFTGWFYDRWNENYISFFESFNDVEFNIHSSFIISDIDDDQLDMYQVINNYSNLGIFDCSIEGNVININKSTPEIFIGSENNFALAA